MFLAAQNSAIWKSWFQLYQNLSLLTGAIWCHSVLPKNVFLKCNTLDFYFFPGREQNFTECYRFISAHGLDLNWLIVANVHLILVNLSAIIWLWFNLTNKSTLFILAIPPLILQSQILHSLESEFSDEKKALSCILKLIRRQTLDWIVSHTILVNTKFFVAQYMTCVMIVLPGMKEDKYQLSVLLLKSI